MNNFFEKYKKLRKDQKIDLGDIENRTKINIKYLTAIEAGSFDQILDPYRRLFLRAYISEIGADPDLAVSELTEYLLKKDIPQSKESEKIEPEKNIAEGEKMDISIPSEKKINKIQDISLGLEKKRANTQTTISPNLIKGILFLVFWVIIIIVIRNITLDTKNENSNSQNNQLSASNTNLTNFEQLKTDFIEVSSQQTVIEQSLPLIIKIVSKKALGIFSVQDSLEVKSFSIAAGDQKTFSFNTNLDILLNHSEGVNTFINGEKIQDIKPQQTPVRLIFLVEPKSVTIKHYSKAG
ncbi:helix-turn-helix domain-containing protein [bacterium]|nr:helix-turn-helix domain-containing protein [bacterium]